MQCCCLLETTDVLNVSKLSANLVTLTMSDFRPYDELSNIIRMFRDEGAARGIKVQFDKDQSWDRLQVEGVRGDSGRFTQIVVNILRCDNWLCGPFRWRARSSLNSHSTATPSNLQRVPRDTMSESVLAPPRCPRMAQTMIRRWYPPQACTTSYRCVGRRTSREAPQRCVCSSRSPIPGMG